MPINMWQCSTFLIRWVMVRVFLFGSTGGMAADLFALLLITLLSANLASEEMPLWPQFFLRLDGPCHIPITMCCGFGSRTSMWTLILIFLKQIIYVGIIFTLAMFESLIFGVLFVIVDILFPGPTVYGINSWFLDIPTQLNTRDISNCIALLSFQVIAYLIGRERHHRFFMDEFSVPSRIVKECLQLIKCRLLSSPWFTKEFCPTLSLIGEK